MADPRLVGLARLVPVALIAVVAVGCGGEPKAVHDPAPSATAPASSPTPTPTPTPEESAAPTRAVPPRAQRIAGAFVEFASHPDAASVTGPPFADRVALGLGSTVLTTVPRSDLARPATWDLVMEGYAGRSGALNPLAGIRDLTSGGGTTVVSTGVHDHCASPPLPVPDEFTRDLEVVIQPSWDDIDSCLEWFSVDLFVRDDRIVAVTLSLFEP